MKSPDINNLNIEGLTVFPNPTNGIIKVKAGNETITNISITDLLGKVIYENKNVNAYELDIEVSNQIKGAYLVHVATEKGNKTVKILLQ